MPHVTMTEEMPCSAARLWTVLGNFGDVSWIPGLKEVEIEGEGPGMARVFGEVREVLEHIDSERKTLTYTIPHGIPLPVTGYRATMQVTPKSTDTCMLEWRCEFEPAGVDTAEATKAVENLYTMMFGWIRDHVAKA